MLNELHDLAQSLKAVEVTMASWHMHFKTCPKGTATYFVLLDSSGKVTDLEPITDRERIASIRKWEVAAGISFPAFNVLPLYEPTGEEAKKTAVELRKAITSKSPPTPDEIKQRLESLVGASASLWVKKEPARITKCLTTLADEIGCVLGAPPDDHRSIMELITRSEMLTAENLQAQLTSVLANKIVGVPSLVADWFDALFFHSGKVAKKWSLIAELADRSAFAYPANHERVQVWMNSRFQAVDEPSEQTTSDRQNEQADAFANPAIRLDESFPSVRLPVLGSVILRSMSSESPCQRRYGFADSQSCRVGQVSRQDMKNALEWIGHPDRRETTWCDVSSLNAVSGVLFAYPSQKPEVDPELAGLIVGLDNEADPDGAKFEACAARVTASLTELVRKRPHEAPATEVRVFVLTKPDGFRTKVLNSARYSVERLLTSANEWKACCRNVPSLLIRQFGAQKVDKPFWAEPFIPYPAEVVSCLNTAWERAGTHPEQVPGFGIGDGLGLLLEDGVVLNAIATRAIRTLVTNSLSLVLALSQAQRQGLVHPMGKKYGKQALLLPSIFGLLLAKLGRLKGDYMKGPPFLVGRLLSLADQLHLQYCQGVRKGQVPPQLVGNALMATALEQPTKAVAVLSQRILPYQAWARTIRGGEGDDVLQGDAGSDSYYFEGSNDLGNDTITEAADTDTYDLLHFNGLPSAITIDLSSTAQQTVRSVGGASKLKLTLSSASGVEYVAGSEYDDTMTGNSRDNLLYGYGGNDTAHGGTGGDVLRGHAGTDTLYGDDGNDFLLGGDGDDTLYGNADHDTLWGDGGNDTLDGAAGNDAYWFDGSTDLGADTVSESGSDLEDQLHFENWSYPVTIDLSLTSQQTVSSSGGNSTLKLTLTSGTAIENVYGSAYSDSITGNSRTNDLYGNAGNDTIHGGDAGDYIYGGDGDDSLYGDAGFDYLYGEAGTDTLDVGADGGNATQ